MLRLLAAPANRPVAVAVVEVIDGIVPRRSADGTGLAPDRVILRRAGRTHCAAPT